jgi:Tol biopolymer transport system component
MGVGVNSAGEDHSPALSFDGDTLFFSSTRPGGFGLTDIYVTTRTGHGKVRATR